MLGLGFKFLISTLILEFIGLLCACIIIVILSFGVEHIPKEIKTFINHSLSITTNIFKTQAYNSIMCKYFCIGFIDFMLAGETLAEFTNLFSLNNF